MIHPCPTGHVLGASMTHPATHPTPEDIRRERLVDRLIRLYGPERAAPIADRLLALVEAHGQHRVHSGRDTHWTQEDLVLITYGDIVQTPAEPPLRTLRAFLARHLSGRLSMLHILPFFPYSSDDGFAVSDFRSVDPELGDWTDIAALAEDWDLAMDLVLNHCSREHPWLFDLIAGKPPGDGYFIEVDPAENLSRVTRPRATPLLTPVRTHRGVIHLWTTFSADQLDLDYRNPEVLVEMVDTLLDYVQKGARLIRLDAVAYLWKELGTSCIHHPLTHEVVKLIREVLEQIEPRVLIMTETNVPHAENISYFGLGDEAHVVYQFSLPPLLLHAIFSGTTAYLRGWAKELEPAPLPPGCTFLNFTASHDGVGLRPLEGLVPAEEVRVMLDAMRRRGGYISTKRNMDGSASPYELNISYFDAFRPVEDTERRWHIPAFLLSQVVALSFKGIAAVYFHCLTATPNDYTGVERTGMTRSINRRKWDLGELETLIADCQTDTGRVFAAYRRLLGIRRRQHAFHPDGSQRVLDLEDGLLGLERTAPDNSQRILALYNFRPESVRIDLQALAEDPRGWNELLGMTGVRLDHLGLYLPPYGACWLSKGGERRPAVGRAGAEQTSGAPGT
jgi:glycosidase